jgi:Lar family restriction alleviation protein
MSELDEKALKPCPFCGGPAIVWRHLDRGFLRVKVICDACNVQGPATCASKEAGVVDAWNRRAPAALAHGSF